MALSYELNPDPNPNSNLNPNPNLKPSPNPNPTLILTLIVVHKSKNVHRSKKISFKFQFNFDDNNISWKFWLADWLELLQVWGNAVQRKNYNAEKRKYSAIFLKFAQKLSLARKVLFLLIFMLFYMEFWLNRHSLHVNFFQVHNINK